ncbi:MULTISPECIES: hypothetical protein [unclassified Duganella]|uniref:hypothetical protein n=1 Tax=unclassified Duganella TaxID=2636909 RepID=UPI000884F537|nr:MULTISPECIES: hypothetical protein [unclassified Duganella]SDF80402.1 hypothetical protein SAMN05216320_1011374 [Duganella sp. OV458]SDI48827.1 hypothetical protein SAMN05428973_10141 [Duganella sp. OV510]
MTITVFPPKGSRSHALLVALQQGPATFYQACERAGFDIEDSRLEEALRHIFDHMIGGNVRLVGITYHLTAEARTALGELQPTPYCGQLAGPAYRGIPHPTTVYITRRPEGARA